MKVTSPDFENESSIPFKHSKKGENVPPDLWIEGIPENTKSLAILMMDCGNPLIKVAHWSMWNIPPENKKISGNTFKYPQGKNSFGKSKYLGPCPPFGKHEYTFRIYALDTFLELPQGSRVRILLKEMKNHIIEEATITGTYEH